LGALKGPASGAPPLSSNTLAAARLEAVPIKNQIAAGFFPNLDLEVFRDIQATGPPS